MAGSPMVLTNEPRIAMSVWWQGHVLLFGAVQVYSEVFKPSWVITTQS